MLIYKIFSTFSSRPILFFTSFFFWSSAFYVYALVLFYADYRVPHEVLAAHSDRLAITLWYFDGAERERAQQRGTAAAAATDAAEAAAIAGEIERFEARFGAADEVRRVVADPESEIM